MQRYELVYSVSDAGFADWPLLLVGGCMLAFGIGFSIWLRRSRPDAPHWIGYLFGLVGFSCGGGGALVAYVQQQSVVGALENGGARVVEGPVEAIDRPAEQRDGSFRVAGQRFFYSAYERQQGFEEALLQPGVIARVHYVEDTILRLEVREPTASEARSGEDEGSPQPSRDPEPEDDLGSERSPPAASAPPEEEAPSPSEETPSPAPPPSEPTSPPAEDSPAP